MGFPNSRNSQEINRLLYTVNKTHTPFKKKRVISKKHIEQYIEEPEWGHDDYIYAYRADGSIRGRNEKINFVEPKPLEEV